MNFITITASWPQITAHIHRLHCKVNCFIVGQASMKFPSKLHTCNTHYSEATVFRGITNFTVLLDEKKPINLIKMLELKISASIK